MALLGSSIDPRLFQQDYSGYVRAAETQAQGVANLAQSIGGAIKDFAEEKKRINQDIAKGKSALQFAKANYPELADRIDEIGKIFSDVNVSKAEQAAAGSQMGDFVTAMIRGQEFNTEVDLKKRALDIQEAEALARNEPKPVVYDFEPVEIPAEYGGQPGVLRADKDPRSGIIRASDGKLYRNEEDFKLQRNPIIQSNIDAGLNTGIPLTASDIERRAIEINNALEIPDSNNAVEANPILLNDFPDGMPVATETPAPLGAPTMTKPPVIDALPPGFVPIQTETTEPTFRPATKEELSAYGAVGGQIDESTGRFYPITLPQGMTVESDGQGGIKVVQGAGVGGKEEKAAVERQKQQGGFVDEFTKTAAETIKLLPNLPDNPVGAKFGAILGEVLPGTEQGRVVSRLNTLKANLALDKINQMRAASPTGGAAGNMTEKEWPLFMQEFGALDAAGDKKDLEARLKNASIKLVKRVNGTPEERQSALEEGVITKKQNEVVQKQYEEMLSSLGVPVVKSKPTIGLSSEAEEARRIIRGQ